ncbi:hypothetical protein B0O99DRAFT_640151 [Bisporella sp. PMI_857]|nr:hypothetical protein B0O99DRAFT_640151 [Bisporella sp. PMI_857]
MVPSNGYGALSNSTASNRTSAHKEPPLLGHPVLISGWRKKMANVYRDWADIVLLVCYIITGLLDSAFISTWGSFISMQTGNIIYVGLGLAAPHEPKGWIKSGVSFIAFCMGSFWFSRFHQYLTPSRHWVLCVSILAQMGLITIAAAILTWGPGPTNEKVDIDWSVLVPIALVAFQGCGQAITSRALRYNVLPSVVLTGIYCDLFSDTELFALHNAERNRRLCAPVLLLFGVIIGSLLAHSSIGMAGVLWIAAGLKLFIVLPWLWQTAED